MFCQKCLAEGRSACSCSTTTFPQTINTPIRQLPYKCPVCDGTGLVSRPPGIAGDLPSWQAAGTGPYNCKPCNGSGIVWGHT